MTSFPGSLFATTFPGQNLLVEFTSKNNSSTYKFCSWNTKFFGYLCTSFCYNTWYGSLRSKNIFREAFCLRDTESWVKVAKGLLAKVCKNLSKMDKAVSTYLESNNYFITSPKKHDPNYDILSESFNRE